MGESSQASPYGAAYRPRIVPGIPEVYGPGEQRARGGVVDVVLVGFLLRPRVFVVQGTVEEGGGVLPQSFLL